MNQNFEINAHESTEPVSKYAIAIRYGLMTGFVLMFITTIGFLYLLKYSFIVFSIVSFISYIVPVIPVIFYYLAAKRQQALLGGFISLKDAFQVVFISILIAVAIFTIYGLIYNKYIDPENTTRMKEAALTFFEEMKMPQEQLDAQMKNIEEQTKDSTSFSKLSYSVSQSIILHSIFGFIVALIVSRKKPAAQQ
jgi:uncharacterized membrane protein (DUF106 family)